MSLQKNKDVIRRHYEELFNDRRLEIAAEITAEDYVEPGVAALAERVGDRPDAVEGLKGTVRWLTGAFPDLRIEINDLVAEGDKVLGFLTFTEPRSPGR